MLGMNGSEHAWKEVKCIKKWQRNLRCNSHNADPKISQVEVSTVQHQKENLKYKVKKIKSRSAHQKIDKKYPI